MAKDIVDFGAREPSLSNEWETKNKLISVNTQQTSFDSKKRRDQFDKNLCITKEELEFYNWYRSEWYRRPNEFDPRYSLAVACELVSSCNLSCSMCYTITEEFQDSIVGNQEFYLGTLLNL